MTLVADFNSSVNVPFQRMRALLGEAGGGLQAGVIGANDLKVAQRGAGANQSVDVPAGAAWVAITTGTRNGLGHVYSDAIANVTVAASDATNPRVDQIILRWNDSSIPTGSGNVPTLAALTGTPTAGAQITAPQTTATYRLGAAALPNDCLRLADILVPATSTSVTTANIVDRRPWARGARWSVMRTTANVSGSSAFATPDATFTNRIECSGADIRFMFTASYTAPAAGARTLNMRVLMDAATSLIERDGPSIAASATGAVAICDVIPVSAGSHTFAFQYITPGASDGSLLANPTVPVVASVEEILKPNAANT